jgi:hypothetical protein
MRCERLGNQIDIGLPCSVEFDQAERKIPTLWAAGNETTIEPIFQE